MGRAATVESFGRIGAWARAKSALGGLALLGVVALGAGLGGTTTVRAEGPTPTASADCLQECLDELISNQERCHDANCNSFFGLFTIRCSTDALNYCLAQAKALHAACVRECNSPRS